MLKCTHLIENRIYLISGKSIEGLKIFKNATEKRKFRNTLRRYLSDLCELIHYEIFSSEFHLVIKIQDRNKFEQFYSQKYKGRIKETFFIPISTHIFGRQMSNLQVSFVKSYNRKFKRKGMLVDGRYRRYLIEGEAEMKKVIYLLKSGRLTISQLGKNRINISKRLENEGEEKKEKKRELICKWNLDIGSQGIKEGHINLRGCFEVPFRQSLIPPFLSLKIKIFRANHPCGPNYN